VRDRKHERELRLLDLCLNELENAHERGETILSERLAQAVGAVVGPLVPGMSIADAMEIIFQEQEHCLAGFRRSAPEPEARAVPRPPAPRPAIVPDPDPVTAGGLSRRERGPMTATEARMVTDRIRTATRHVCILLREVHERRAWVALGYPSWETYVQSEFNISRSRAYELLDQARVILDLQNTAGIDELPDVSPYVAMQIKPRLPQIREDIRQRVGGATGPAAVQIVAELVEEHRQQVARGRRLVRERRAARERGEWEDSSQFWEAIDLVSGMAAAGRSQELLEAVEPPQIEDIESAVHWLNDFLAVWRQRRRPRVSRPLVLARNA